MSHEETPPQNLRQQIRKRRRQLGDRPAKSQVIMDRIGALPAVAQSSVCLWYVDHRDEVITRQGIEVAWQSGKTVVVPRCEGEQLELFHIQDWSDLSAGSFGILEPSRELDSRASRIAPEEIEVAIIPSVAVDRSGSRLGSGKGFYDRLLPNLRASTVRIAPVFECQMVESIERQSHDQPVDIIVNEFEIIPCPSR